MGIDSLLSDMALTECREKTFKKWPFKRGSCSAKEMAKAGFYAISLKSTETITCYYCFKELEGWESTDVPFLEHKKHAPYCCFIKTFENPPESLSLKQVLELELGRVERKMEVQKKGLTDLIETCNDEIIKALQSAKNPIRKRIVKYV